MGGKIIMPGTVVEYGDEEMTVGAVGFTGGERYYWMTTMDGMASAMIPATIVEKLTAKESKP